MLDRIDGGFSLFLHAPGFLLLNTENRHMVVDGYLPPREVMTHGASLQAPLDKIIQTFMQDIALPHLTYSQQYCLVSELPEEATVVLKLSHTPTGSNATFLVAETGSSHFHFHNSLSFDHDDSFTSLDWEMNWGAVAFVLNDLEKDTHQRSSKSYSIIYDTSNAAGKVLLRNRHSAI